MTPAVYALLMAITLVAFRWPAFYVPHPFDPDESQFIAGALTLRIDPVFWRSVDGQTAGPLVYYALLPMVPLGLANYFGARLVGGVLVGVALWFSYRGLRAVWGEALARMAVLPGFCFFALSTHTQFVHYSSEHVSLALLAIALASVLTEIARDRAGQRWRGEGWIGGLALGAVPFAKLQAVPPAAVLVLGAVGWAATRSEWSRSRRLAWLGRFALGLFAVPLVFALMLTMAGGWRDFAISYLAQNFAYATGGEGWRDPSQAPSTLWRLPLKSWTFGSLAYAAVAVAGGFGASRSVLRPAVRWPLGLLAAMALASGVASLSTRRYPHYLLYLVMPLTLLAGAVIATRWQAAEGAAERVAARRRRLAVVFLGCLVVPQWATKAYIGNPYLAGIQRGFFAMERGPVAREILAQTTPGDRLAIWGWWAEPYVQTGLAQGTREANTAAQLDPGRWREYFRARFLADLNRIRPRFFIDAAGSAPGIFAYPNRDRYRHETFPELRDFVAEHYAFLGEWEGVRLYRRRETAAAR